MHVKPYYVAVLRVRLPVSPCDPYTWEALGMATDLMWDFSTCTPKPFKLGPESETSFMVSASDLGLTYRTCADYKNSVELYTAQLEHDRLHGRPWTFHRKTEEWIPPPPYDHARMDGLKSTIDTVGAEIQSAVDANFPRWLAAAEQVVANPPPWVGATTVTSI